MEIERQTNGAAAPPRASDAAYADVRHPGSWSGSELLARILDGVADGIAAHDASGQLLFINDAGARMCGYDSATAALGVPSGDFFERVQVFDSDGRALAEAELPGPLAARGHVVPERTLRIQLRSGGGERWVSVKATPILDRRGAVRMSISIYRDVTRERRAETERDRVVRELESERKRLAALVEQLSASAERRPRADR
ncbi:MAG TPA: PAS domain-containing protein [Gemmatimonadaceae bacterium]|nr:PAS domain-containing protein [Gemmatimonadaceae bacterium]